MRDVVVGVLIDHPLQDPRSLQQLLVDFEVGINFFLAQDSPHALVKVQVSSVISTIPDAIAFFGVTAHT